jgi:hypothetical protein
MLLRSAELVGWALGGLEREIMQTRERLVSLTSQAAKLRARLGRRGETLTAASSDSSEPARRKRRPMSAAARKRMSDNMKKRWAATKKKGLTRL